MVLKVKERGEHVATYRWICVRLMEMLAAWVPTTPEMEVKLVFGAHIWDMAQHADLFGKRTHELRLPPQFSLKPSEDYAALLVELGAITATDKRVAGFYDCMLPGLARRYRTYLTQVDPMLDGPTVRILERMLFDNKRMLDESQALLAEVPAVRLADAEWAQHLCQREHALLDIVAQPVVAQPAGVA